MMNHVETLVTSAGIIIFDPVSQRVALIESFGSDKRPGESLYEEEFSSEEERFCFGRYDCDFCEKTFRQHFWKKLLFPKGHVETAEDFLETAQRETYEETGIHTQHYHLKTDIDFPVHQRETGQSKSARRIDPHRLPDIKKTQFFFGTLHTSCDLRPHDDHLHTIKRCVRMPRDCDPGFFKYAEDAYYYIRHVQPVIKKHTV